MYLRSFFKRKYACYNKHNTKGFAEYRGVYHLGKKRAYDSAYRARESEDGNESWINFAVSEVDGER